VLKLLMSSVTVGFLIGCQPQTPSSTGAVAPEKADIKPAYVKTNDGIDHEFNRNVSLDALLKQLPSGSVDSVDLSMDKDHRVFALVKVPEQPILDQAKVRFETQFQTQDGQVIQKSWTAAEGRKSGKAIALFACHLQWSVAKPKSFEKPTEREPYNYPADGPLAVLA
jgi:hypothetical protein